MRRILFSIQVTLDGFVDHTAMIADDEVHEYAASLLSTADAALFGRVTYELFANYWPTAVNDTSLPLAVREFARKLNPMPKIVFSKTLESADWSTTIMRAVVPEEIAEMKRRPGRGLLIVGSPSLARTLMGLGLIDDYQFMIQPIVAGHGKPLFRDINQKASLKLKNTRTFKSGVVLLHYEPA
jgi:dihydrofolate reductase